MIFLQQLKHKIGPGAFSKACLRFAALWFLVLHPALLWLYPKALPALMKSSPEHFDVYQYYAGAVVVREHLWDSLYPIPKWEVYHAPNPFEPAYRTFLFDPAVAAKNIAFYPEFNTSLGSTWAPKLKQAFPEAADFSFVYPPPTALLCSPLALFDFNRSAMCVWPTVAVVFLFVLTFFSSQIYRVLQGGVDSYGEGIVTLACLVFAVCGPTDIPLGNVTPVLSGCVACCIYSLMRCRMLAFSCAYIPLVLFKSIGLAWLPLLVINRTYRRVLIYLAAITVILNGIVLLAAGPEFYRTFFSLLPLISIPLGPGIQRLLIVDFGIYPHAIYALLNLALLVLLYCGYLKNGDKGWTLEGSRSPLVLAAFLAGTLSVFCLLNNIVWPEYAPNYVFVPLLGWMLQEGNLATGAERLAIRGGLVILYLVFIGQSFWFHFVDANTVDFYMQRILASFSVDILPAFFLLVAMRRLFVKEPLKHQR